MSRVLFHESLTRAIVSGLPRTTLTLLKEELPSWVATVGLHLSDYERSPVAKPVGESSGCIQGPSYFGFVGCSWTCILLLVVHF